MLRTSFPLVSHSPQTDFVRTASLSSPEDPHPNASMHCRGIGKLRVYGFGCPPCVDASLASRCAEVMLTVALRDDVVTRFSPQALERLQKELRALDLEAAKQVTDPSLPSPSDRALRSEMWATARIPAVRPCWALSACISPQ